MSSQAVRWIRSLLKDDEIEKIEGLVRRVELTTSAEIVPMIVRRSSTVGHVPFQVTLLLLLVLLVFEVPQIDFFTDWNVLWLLFVMAVLCYGLGWVLAKFAWVQRLLIPSSDQRFQAEERAQLEFYLAGITGTRAKTGVLLFISLLERRAVILADQAISEKLPADTWNQILAELIASIKDGKCAQGLTVALQKIGEITAQHFPSQGKNPNELGNHLVIKE